jgi:hypothetical protein
MGSRFAPLFTRLMTHVERSTKNTNLKPLRGHYAYWASTSKFEASLFWSRVHHMAHFTIGVRDDGLTFKKPC